MAFKFKLPPMPPEVERYLADTLIAVGKAGAKAAAAATGSAVGDVRRVVKKAEKRLREIEDNAKRVSADPKDDE
jgi:hypothetical protein